MLFDEMCLTNQEPPLKKLAVLPEVLNFRLVSLMLKRGLRKVVRNSEPNPILLTPGISLANYFKKLIYLEGAIFNQNL